MKVTPYMSVLERDKNIHVNEEFKAEVYDKVIKWPKELGTEHPYEFEDAQKVMETVGVVGGIINKIVDNIVGEFSVKCKNPNSKKIIDSFIEDSDFQTVVRDWIREALSKGNGFIELDLPNQKMRVLNANNMYVVRDKKGKVLGYNHYAKDIMKFTITNRNVTPFKPEQIAHFMTNHTPGEAYGIGLIKPNERVIENIVLNEQDLQKLEARKAGAPIHVKVGLPGENTDPAVVDSIKNSLVYMTNRTEWVTDGNIEMKVLEFGQIGKNLVDNLMYNFRMLLAGMNMCEVVMGSGQLNEGIAKVQLESLQRYVASIQDEIEPIIENKIFRPLINSNNLDEKIEFVWNLPGEEEINLRITQLNTLLMNQYMSDGMRLEIQTEIGRLLNFENPEELVNTPNTQGMTADKTPSFTPDGKQVKPEFKPQGNAEKKKEDNLKQPEVPGAKPNAKSEAEIPILEVVCKHHITEQETSDMTIKEFVNLIEIAGFNYSDYLIAILKRIKSDKFEDLHGITEKDFSDGLLTEEQITKLRIILKDGFRKNKSVNDIESEIKTNLGLKDRIKEDGGVIPAETRPNIITRTETVRLANIGLVDVYKENDVEKVRWLAALSDRTCPQCEALNGQVFNIQELSIGETQPPLHVNCRCSLLSVVE